MSESGHLLSNEALDRPLRPLSASSSQMEGLSHHGQDGGMVNGIGRGVVLRRGGMGRRERHTHNGIVFSRPKSEYISPGMYVYVYSQHVHTYVRTYVHMAYGCVIQGILAIEGVLIIRCLDHRRCPDFLKVS